MRSLWLGAAAALAACTVGSTTALAETAPASCEVFCHGPLLDKIQLAGLYNDSKTFVDKPLLVDPDEALAHFHELPANATTADLQTFVDTYFGEVGSDVVSCTPTDFQPNPPRIMDNVTVNVSRQWALDINAIWPQLCREATAESAAHPDRHSLLAPSRPMIVPGGRFRESYYWDSYWIVRGLLVSGMQDSACDVVTNLLESAEKYGFVPNGFRVYYLTRSQPPLLSEMVKSVLDSFDSATSPAGGAERSDYCGFSNRKAFLEKWLPVLDKEYTFWMTNRSIRINNAAATLTAGSSYVLNLYNASTELPRPESYSEDISNGNLAADNAEASGDDPEAARLAFYRGAATAAETGWDFTARWFHDEHNLTTVGKSLPNMVPVELNTYMLRLELNLAQFHLKLADDEQSPALATQYLQAAHDRVDAMDRLMWNASTSRWNDLYFGQSSCQSGSKLASHDGVDAKQLIRTFETSSSFLPLWAGNSSSLVLDRVTEAALALVNSDLWLEGGVVATTVTGTEQQWDAPNAWSPIQHILIEGLLSAAAGEHTDDLRQAARSLAERWLRSNYKAYTDYGKKMFEKYDAENPGRPGGGGEYVGAQLGFGWTNGVVLTLLEQFGDIDVSSAAGATHA